MASSRCWICKLTFDSVTNYDELNPLQPDLRAGRKCAGGPTPLLLPRSTIEEIT